jgi:hypothetical protein
MLCLSVDAAKFNHAGKNMPLTGAFRKGIVMSRATSKAIMHKGVKRGFLEIGGGSGTLGQKKTNLFRPKTPVEMS